MYQQQQEGGDIEVDVNQQHQGGVGMDEAEREASMEGEREREREREIELQRAIKRDKGIMYEAETIASSSHGAEPAMVNEAIRGMGAVLFNAARKGNFKIIIEKITPGEVQTTPTGKTVLHIASEFNRYECVREILKRDRGLLIRVDTRGDTALHLAARMGNFKAAEALTEAKDPDIESRNLTTTVEEVIRMTNNRGNTALHEAVDVRDPSMDIVRMLVEKYPECGEYLPNKRSKTPLYVAAEKGHEDVALLILRRSISPRHDGPTGRTTLHAAVISNLGGLTEKLLSEELALAKRADDDGWTPLHWAAYLNHTDRVKQLLERDPTLAYIMDKDGSISLHVASMNNSVSSMKMITSICPDCYDMVDWEGRNAFHYAVMHGRTGSTKFLRGGSLFHSLFSEGDKEGNTTLHLSFPEVETASPPRAYLVPKISKEVKKEEESREESGYRESSYLGNQLVVATLIATVSFAAGFTLPGGYNDSGNAILSSKPMFKAFVFTDTLAFLLSTAAVFLHFRIPPKASKNEMYTLGSAGFGLTFYAMAAMWIAFITGVSVALESSGLHTAILTIGVVLLFIIFRLLRTFDFLQHIRTL